MDEAGSYWAPLVELRLRLDGWVRVAWRDGDAIEEGTWGKLFLIPTSGYLEGPDGPWPFRVIEWIDVSTLNVSLNVYRPPLFTDIKHELLAGLQGTQLRWELRETTWTMERVFRSTPIPGFRDKPVQVMRFPNPFGPKPGFA